jgi:AcrR family transcriptional regulator
MDGSIRSELVDPRIRRTRLLLQQALKNLLETKEFDKISVQEIAEAATVNRATFYDHYSDKYALLECMVGSRFDELLAKRGVKFDGSCSSALRAIVLGVCDFLAGLPGMDCSERQRQIKPHMESAIIAVVRRMILDGLKRHESNVESSGALSAEMIAATAAWAIYGAAKEWVHSPNRCSSEEIAGTVVTLVSPILTFAARDMPH